MDKVITVLNTVCVRHANLQLDLGVLTARNAKYSPKSILDLGKSKCQMDMDDIKCKYRPIT